MGSEREGENIFALFALEITRVANWLSLKRECFGWVEKLKELKFK